MNFARTQQKFGTQGRSNQGGVATFRNRITISLLYKRQFRWDPRGVIIALAMPQPGQRYRSASS